MTAALNEATSETVPAAALADELDRHDEDLRRCRMTLADLKAREDEMALATDEEAEQYDLDCRRAERACRRLELLRPEIENRLAEAREREAEEERARMVAAAETEVAEALDAVKKYERPARQIAGIVEKWVAATAAARKAGIPTPNERLRTIPGKVHEERHEYEVTQVPSITIDGRVDRGWDSRNGVVRAPKPRIVRTIPARQDPATVLPDWAHDISLPAVTPGDKPFV